MSFLYSQIDGSFWEDTTAGPQRRAICYAGCGLGLNNPHYEAVHNIGPIPVGGYKIRPLVDKHLGPIVFELVPDADNDAHGRTAFRIHWDNAQANYTASEGCIVNNGHFNVIGVTPAGNFFGWLQAQVAAGNAHLEVIAQPPLSSPGS